MQLEDIRYFVDAALHQSLAKASSLNHISAPAVSQAIRRLEGALGCELLVHRKNRFKLTEAGEILLRQSQQLLRTFDDLRGVVRAKAGSVAGTLAFATSHSIALSILPDCLHALSRRHPKLQPSFRLGGTPLIKSWVESREVECGITLDDGKLGNLSRVSLFKGHFEAVFPKRLSDSAISQLGFLTTASRPEVEMLSRYVEKRLGCPFPQKMVVDSWEVIRRMTRLGLGIGLVPDYLLRESNSRRGLVPVFEDLPRIPYEFCIVFEEEAMLSINARAFVEFIKPYAARTFAR